MTFSCPVDQVIRAKKALTEAMSADLINYKELIADTLVAKISIVGNGMRVMQVLQHKCLKF
jgi:aspartate kinase